MTEGSDYQYMHYLVDRLTPTQVRRLRLLMTEDEELSQAAAVALPPRPDEERPVPAGFLALIGAVDGPEDLAERHDDYIRERMRERFGDQA